MRVNIISDLHLEFGDLYLPGGDVLLISGDVCESRTLRKYKYDPHNLLGDNGHEGKRLDRAQRFFIEEVGAKYRHAIYVMGNHEHYHTKFSRTWHELIAEMPDNVEVLENQSMEIDGVLFMGATLWTDCNKGDPLTIQTLKNGMQDYRAITHLKNGIYRKLIPMDTMEAHMATKQFFSEEIEKNPGKDVVICTHHAPSYKSVHPHYAHDTHMNGGYASDLSEFILDRPQIKYWTHGHMHDPSDYMIGDCRVICNPRGYKGYEQQVNVFDPTVGFDI